MLQTAFISSSHPLPHSLFCCRFCFCWGQVFQASNLRSSCLRIPNAGGAGVSHHSRLRNPWCPLSSEVDCGIQLTGEHDNSRASTGSRTWSLGRAHFFFYFKDFFIVFNYMYVCVHVSVYTHVQVSAAARVVGLSWNLPYLWASQCGCPAWKSRVCS